MRIEEVGLGADCDVSEDAATGLVRFPLCGAGRDCSTLLSEPRTCKSYVAEGDPCDLGDICAPRTSCRGGICTAVSRAYDPGAPCERGCPPEGVYCDDVGACAVTDGSDGASCDDDVDCTVDLVCIDRLCRDPRPDGDPCDVGFHCASACCSSVDRVCR